MARAPLRITIGACRRRWRVAWCLGLLGVVGTLAPATVGAETVVLSSPFAFAHSASVSTGLVSIGGTFVNTVTTPSTLTFARFDTSLGELTGVSVAVTTSTATFSVTPTGLLGLTTAASTTRSFGYTVAGVTGASDSATLSSNPTALLTLLGLGAVEVGGAPLASTRAFTSATDLAPFAGAGTTSVTLRATDVLSVSVGVSLLNGSGLNGSGSYAGTVAVTYTYTPRVFVSGRSFKDDGAGAGTANDGVRNGGEAGLQGGTMQLLDANGTVLDATISDAAGGYRLLVPPGVTNGATLRVRQLLPDTSVATGASLGSSGGIYSRPTTTVALPYATGVAVTGVDFGSVPTPGLAATGNQGGAPGTVLFYGHRYTATTAGEVTFGASHVSAPAIAGWTETVYVDANQNGAIDAGELPATAAVPVVAGQVVHLVVKVSIPQSAPTNARVQGTVSASLAFANASPPLTRVASIFEVTDVLSPASASLQLRKTVDKTTASPGDAIVYAITFTNSGASALSNVVISDATPAWTTFVSATPIVLPAAIGIPVETAPAVGASGPLRWTFPGLLAPDASGIIEFTVRVVP